MNKLNTLLIVLSLSVATVTGQTRLSIDSIQSTILPGTNDTSFYMDSMVTTSGIVTTVSPTNSAYIIQSGDSAWDGIYVYDPDSVSQVKRGDSLTLRAVVNEYYGLTQLLAIDTFLNHDVADNPPVPLTVSTGNAAQEAYESVLLEVVNATCSADSNQYGEWEVDDGSGIAIIDDYFQPHAPTVGGTYNITGPLYYSFGSFKIEPRDTADIDLVSTGSVSYVSIKEIQSQTMNGDSSVYIDSSAVVTSGIVTGTFNGGGNRGYFIQQDSAAWQGLYVQDSDSARVAGLARGDSISVTGNIHEYFGKTMMTNVSSVTIHKNGLSEPSAAVVMTANVNSEKYEGVKVQVKDATCTQGANQYNEWVVDDGSGSNLVNDLMFLYEPIVTAGYTVRGVVDYSFGNFKIEPRDSNDIMKTAPPDPITSIKEIQQSTVSSTNDTSTYIDSSAIRTTGIITGTYYEPANSSTGYIVQQDSGAWEGIFVYDQDSLRVHSLSRGDSVTIAANVDEFYSKTQLTNISSIKIHQSGVEEPQPIISSTAAAHQEKYEGVKVQVRNATCTKDTGIFNEWVVKDNSDSSVSINDLMFEYGPIVTTKYHVTGVVNYAYGNFKMEPRDSNDIIVSGSAAPITSIYDIQSTLSRGDTSTYIDSSNVRIKGIITATFFTPDNKGFFVQEDSGAWHGIYVYHPDSQEVVSLDRGDEVTATGQISEYYGRTQLTNVADITVNSSNNTTPVPYPVQTGNASQEKFEGVLCRVKNATCTQDTGFFNEWLINDGSDSSLIVNDMMFAFGPEVQENYHVTGIIDYSFGDFKLEPRDRYDIIHVTGINEATPSASRLYPNPTSGRLNIRTSTGEGEKRVKVFNKKGSLVYQGTWQGKHHTINTRRFENGMYFMKIKYQNGVEHRKVVIQH